MPNIITPTFGESISDATVARWKKNIGDAVLRDEVIVELETDKVVLEVYAPENGILAAVSVVEGASVTPGTILGQVDSYTAGASLPPAAEGKRERVARRAAGATPPTASPPSAPRPPAAVAPPPDQPIVAAHVAPMNAKTEGREERRVPMTRVRLAIARRLKESQNTAAILTTFNEVDMSALISLRALHGPRFLERHGVKLGFMAFFVQACVAALRSVPEVNSEIQGSELIYKEHYDIGVAVGTDRGLVVPVVRAADALGIAEIEKVISELAKRARAGTLELKDLEGGTFTITNGGIYGSLMSTPILNSPQSGILGMHAIQERPVCSEGHIVGRPMMYIALSYDHRVVDGKQAVTFLVKVKEAIEDPQRLMLAL